jgi:dephospho-CoA kinase
MIVLGLTGSIGMGKSTAAQQFRHLGVPVFDADASVHALQAPGGIALGPLSSAFPGVVTNGVLDRAVLRQIVFADKAALRQLEAIMHPLVRRAQNHWLRLQRQRREPVVVLDIPLLFESGGWRQVDAIVVVTAPYHVQKARVLARPGMTEDAFARILAQQLPDAIKRRRADFSIHSGLGKQRALRDIRYLLSAIRVTGLHSRKRRT